MTSVCVVQPRILPPLYYLRRMRDADVVVFLLSAQYTRKSRDAAGRAGFTGQSHFRMLGGWVGVPLQGPRRVPVDAVALSEDPAAVQKLKDGLAAVDEPGQWFMRHYEAAPTLGDLGRGHIIDLFDHLLKLPCLFTSDRELDITADHHTGSDWRAQAIEVANRTCPKIGAVAQHCRFWKGDGLQELTSVAESTVDWVVAFGVFSLLPTDEDPMEAIWLFFSQAARIRAGAMVSLLDATYQPPGGQPDIESNWFFPPHVAEAAIGALPRSYHVEIRRDHIPNDFMVVGRPT